MNWFSYTFTVAAVVIGGSLIINSCSRDNEEDLFGQDCNTEDVRYSTVIAAIMQAHCNSCHLPPAAPANVVTTNYSSLREIAINGRLLGAIKHQTGFVPMPYGMPKLDNCLILQIETWINAGILND
jgi:hypothetical protein